MDNKRNYSLIRFAPIAIIFAAWVPQGLYRFFVDNTPFAKIATAVYGLVGVAIICYVCGALIGRRVDRSYLLLRAYRSSNVTAPIEILSPSPLYKKFRLVIVALALAFFLNAFLLQVLSGVDMSALRDDALSEWSEGGVLVKLMAVGVNALACLLLLCISLEHRSYKRINLALVLLFVFVCLAAYARTLLLIGLFILMLRMIATHSAPIRLVIKLMSGFVFLFLLLAFFGKDNSANENGVVDILLGHAEVYFFGGVSGLNNFFLNGEPQYNSTLSVPRFIQGIIPIFGEPPPQYFDFVETPLPLNVFTAIYPPFHDFGVMGVVILFFVYGVVTAAACRKFATTDSYVWQVVAGFLLYATAMSIFDDQFIRALPVFLIFVSAAVIFKLLQPIFEIKPGVAR
jgi:oligosaccharide repeat unit polymerase